MSINDDLYFIDTVADGGLGAPDYFEAYQRVLKALNQITDLEAKLQAAEAEAKFNSEQIDLLMTKFDALRSHSQAAEAELAEWKEYNPTPAGLLAERKRANDADADRDALSEKLRTLSDKLQAAEETGAKATQMMVAAVADMFTVQEERDEWESRAEAAEAEVARLTMNPVTHEETMVIACQESRIAELEAEVKNFAENFDCDMDAHRLGTHCRACRAKALLGEGK